MQGRLARTGTGRKHPGAQMVVRALGGELEPLPPVSLDGVTPETRAANSLKTLFTMVAVGIVLDQVSNLPLVRPTVTSPQVSNCSPTCTTTSNRYQCGSTND